MKQYIPVLTIAGSDPSGGAGIQADIKTFSALGCYAMSVLTALTAQNTQGVTAVQTIPAEFMSAQIQAIFADIQVAAIKIGMLHNENIIAAVAEQLAKLSEVPVVLDPVMIAKSGHTLLDKNAVRKLKKLFPHITLLTPNIPEAELLLQQTIQTPQQMQAAAKKLCDESLSAVLIKGGHLKSANNSADLLYIKTEDKYYWFEKPWVDTFNTHGTGCTLSAAIAAYLAKGFNLIDAVGQAKDYLYHALLAGADYQLGKGCGPVQHFHQLWD